MTLRKQREHLKKVIDSATKLRQHLQPILDAYGSKVHFRPSSGGVSMIGLTRERPQRGKSNIRDLARLAANFDGEFEKHCVDIDQGRPTKEKRLQSWLIAEAHIQDRHMASLNRASEATNAPVDLVFVTDEIPVPIEDGRIVCDILAVRVTTTGYVPVVMELKSDRQMKRLVEQVEGYAAIVDQHIDLYGELFGALLGRQVVLMGPAEKWIVWRAVGDEPDPRAGELAELAIRVVGYREEGVGFKFRTGAARTSCFGPRAP